MKDKMLTVSASPHIQDRETTRRLMLAVVLALVPTLVASAIIFGLRVLLLTGVTVATCVAFEWIYCVLMKQPIPVGDFSAVVTGLILAFNLPPSFPLWMATLGSFVAIVVVKQLFGGIGRNFANPALVGRIVLQVSFTGAMINYTAPTLGSGADVLAGATPLAAVSSPSLLSLLFGTHLGTLGETCAITLVLGGLFLLFAKVIGPMIPASYIGGVFLFKLVLTLAGGNTFAAALGGSLAYILSGGLLLGAFFMATDYATSPYTTKGRLVYGVGLAILTVAMREWARSPEGVSYALLLMNLLVPYINEICRTRPLGATKKVRRTRAAGKGAV